MNGAIVILLFLAFCTWVYYLKNQQRRQFFQSKEAYIRDILGRYPTAAELEKLVQSGEWAKLMDLYGKPFPYDSRFTVLLLAGVGILGLCVAIACTFITIYVDKDLIYASAIFAAIGIGLLINAAILRHYLKKWKL